MAISPMQIVLLSLVLFYASALDKEWTQWSCDEITPNLCDLRVETGSLSIRSIDVKYWRYQRREPVSNDDANKQISLPIIALHGGPGWPHNYLLPLKQLACRSTSEVIFYDQAGAGKSTISKKDSLPHHLLDAKYYSEEELPALIHHWKLDKYHVIGHSWGTMLAQLFTLNAENKIGLQSLTLAGPLSDAKSYIDAQWDEQEGNLASLPPFVQGRIKSLEQDGAYDSAEYEAIDDVLTTFFTLRTAPAPDCFVEAENRVNKEIYVGMQGASEFTFGGTLEHFNVTERLKEITIPVLLTHGKYDTMRPSIVKTMEREIKLSKRKMLPHSGHVSMIDDAGLLNDYIADFLYRVETNSFVSIQDDTDVATEQNKAGERNMKLSIRGYITHLVLTFVLGVLLGRMKWICGKDDNYRRIE